MSSIKGHVHVSDTHAKRMTCLAKAIELRHKCEVSMRSMCSRIWVADGLPSALSHSLVSWGPPIGSGIVGTADLTVLWRLRATPLRVAVAHSNLRTWDITGGV